MNALFYFTLFVTKFFWLTIFQWEFFRYPRCTFRRKKELAPHLSQSQYNLTEFVILLLSYGCTQLEELKIRCLPTVSVQITWLSDDFNPYKEWKYGGLCQKGWTYSQFMRGDQKLKSSGCTQSLISLSKQATPFRLSHYPLLIFRGSELLISLLYVDANIRIMRPTEGRFWNRWLGQFNQPRFFMGPVKLSVIIGIPNVCSVAR